MSDSLDRVVRAGIGAGILACVVAAVAVPTSPLAGSARARWSSGNPVARHVLNRTYTIDATAIAGRERPYAGAPLSVPGRDDVSVRGWAFDPATRRSADRFVYRVDGGPWRDAAYHLPRPDVAAALGLPDALASGFRADVAAGALAPGTHRVAFATIAGTATQPIPQALTVVVTAR
ncbi:MAG: hypothetical protein M3169_10945 [Candidatus Eremiobacteraeota bacterium]|nr:hypothetical protein [Candidatus Eremiobacteraeota bacterium]